MPLFSWSLRRKQLRMFRDYAPSRCVHIASRTEIERRHPCRIASHGDAIGPTKWIHRLRGVGSVTTALAAGAYTQWRLSVR
ncbi:MAG: hypothetical protein A3G25_14195 [Betaproteobacteria bacterium RIFCSPLOWO2_12_FULL_63_13]|nr:MAG: hypothetical protein A3G25_14195 [Betaproteobacteria bacterium RIFCSPLOWO2_12_FULL_63_13]